MSVDQGVTIVNLSGAIDEGFKAVAGSLTARINTNQVVFICDDVDQINSIGIFHWMTFMTSLGKKAKMTFRGCSLPLIDSCNLIPDFLGNGRIESLFVPFECKKGHEWRRLVSLDAGKAAILAPVACETCGGLSKPLVDEEYLVFLETQK